MKIDFFEFDHTLQALVPQAIVDVMRAFPEKLILAGGFFRSLIKGEDTVNDLDLFVTEQAIVLKVRDALIARGFTLTKESKNSLTFDQPTRDTLEETAAQQFTAGVPVQLVTRFFAPSPQELVESFDFTICQFAAWQEVPDSIKKYPHLPQPLDWATYMTPAALIDTTFGRLIYTMPSRDEDVGASLIRSYKFAARGFKPSKETMAKLVGRVMARSDYSRDENTNARKLTEVFESAGYPMRREVPEIEEVPFVENQAPYPEAFRRTVHDSVESKSEYKRQNALRRARIQTDEDVPF